MEQCLIDNKVCPIQGKKCKECKLDDCKRTIEMIETQEEREEKWKRKLINVQLPQRLQRLFFFRSYRLR